MKLNQLSQIILAVERWYDGEGQLGDISFHLECRTALVAKVFEENYVMYHNCTPVPHCSCQRAINVLLLYLALRRKKVKV